MLRGKYLSLWAWLLNLKINRVPDSLKDYVCTKFGQNSFKDIDSRVVTRMWRVDRRKDGSITLSLHNFVGEGIKSSSNDTLRIINIDMIGKSICIFHKEAFYFKEVSFELLFIPSPTKLWRDRVTLPSFRLSIRHILVTTLESISLNEFWPNLVHT
jgi:hypothetical protein